MTGIGETGACLCPESKAIQMEDAELEPREANRFAVAARDCDEAIDYLTTLQKH